MINPSLESETQCVCICVCVCVCMHIPMFAVSLGTPYDARTNWNRSQSLPTSPGCSPNVGPLFK